MTIVRLVWLMCCIAMLQSCAMVPATKPTDNVASQILYQRHLLNIATIRQFTLQGRIGVQAEGKGFSGGLHWQHDSANDNIELYSPLGGQIASIKKTVDKVTLVDAKGNSISAADAETLTQTALGWQLPLSGLADWSLGQPTNGTIDAITWDEFGHLNTLKQDGWNIEYQNYSEQNGHFLPSKILLRSEKVNLKLLVEKWDSLNQP